MNKMISFSLFILIYLNFTICKVFGDNLPTDNSQNEDLVYEPLIISEEGLIKFFKHKFNHKKYSQEILPNNLNDLILFFQHGQKRNSKREYLKTVLKTFLQKFKTLEYISSAEFCKLLLQLDELIGQNFALKNLEQNSVMQVYNILYSDFLNHYDVFKAMPENFLQNTSEKICKTILKQEIEHDQLDDISISELRNILIRFIECGLGKVLWSIDDKDNIWEQFKETCNILYSLKDTKLIYDWEDINDVVNSALARFEYLTEVIGAEISPEIYQKAINEVQSAELPWLEIEEYDELITPKKELLLQTLLHGKTKAVANKKFGIVT